MKLGSLISLNTWCLVEQDAQPSFLEVPRLLVMTRCSHGFLGLPRLRLFDLTNSLQRMASEELRECWERWLLGNGMRWWDVGCEPWKVFNGSVFSGCFVDGWWFSGQNTAMVLFFFFSKWGWIFSVCGGLERFDNKHQRLLPVLVDNKFGDALQKTMVFQMIGGCFLVGSNMSEWWLCLLGGYWCWKSRVFPYVALATSSVDWLQWLQFGSQTWRLKGQRIKIIYSFCHNHGSVENGCILKVDTIFLWTHS